MSGKNTWLLNASEPSNLVDRGSIGLVQILLTSLVHVVQIHFSSNLTIPKFELIS